MEARDILIYLNMRFDANWDEIYKHICAKDLDFTEDEVESALKSIKSKVVTALDDDYPEVLKTCFKMPFVLYYYGDLSLLYDREKITAIVGSRNASNYGRTKGYEIAKEIAKEYIIISGMAHGIDSVAHEASIAVNGKTIAVLGSGIDYCYPQDNKRLYEYIKENGLLISEHANKHAPLPTNFPWRNRIIAHCARFLFVPEAKLRSGSQVTVSFALNTVDNIFVLPHHAGEDSLCNRLAISGAALIESIEDFHHEVALGKGKYEVSEEVRKNFSSEVKEY